MPSQSVHVTNEHGLHASPLAQFVTLARSYPDTTIRVRHGDRSADGKSLTGMLTLKVDQGATIEITTDGPRAGDALAALVDLVTSGLRMRRVS